MGSSFCLRSSAVYGEARGFWDLHQGPRGSPDCWRQQEATQTQVSGVDSFDKSTSRYCQRLPLFCSMSTEQCHMGINFKLPIMFSHKSHRKCVTGHFKVSYRPHTNIHYTYNVHATTSLFVGHYHWCTSEKLLISGPVQLKPAALCYMSSPVSPATFLSAFSCSIK